VPYFYQSLARHSRGSGSWRKVSGSDERAPEVNRVNIKKSNLVCDFIFIPSKLMILKNPETQK